MQIQQIRTTSLNQRHHTLLPPLSTAKRLHLYVPHPSPPLYLPKSETPSPQKKRPRRLAKKPADKHRKRIQPLLPRDLVPASNSRGRSRANRAKKGAELDERAGAVLCRGAVADGEKTPLVTKPITVKLYMADGTEFNASLAAKKSRRVERSSTRWRWLLHTVRDLENDAAVAEFLCAQAPHG